jgi:hypothetical protein
VAEKAVVVGLTLGIPEELAAVVMAQQTAVELLLMVELT